LANEFSSVHHDGNKNEFNKIFSAITGCLQQSSYYFLHFIDRSDAQTQPGSVFFKCAGTNNTGGL
jgi:hypothetical protein